MLTYNLNKDLKLPLYEQLYQFIRADIISGVIKGGEKLPSKRDFASHLGVSKVTVESAYSCLISEGYVYSIEKVGYFAEENLVIRSDNKSYESVKENDTKIFNVDLLSNSVPNEQFPFSVWSRIMREVIFEYSREILDPIQYNGTLVFREAICKYLFEEKGMNVAPSQVVVGAGSEYLYSLLIKLLGTEKKYGIENPSYHKIKKIYELHNANVSYIDVCNNSIDLKSVIQADINVLHLSPSHNFPTGSIINIKQRYEIISWANERVDRYIIEDEFDSELRFNSRPLPPMQTLDTQDKVIYINTFSKTVAPSIRISYMVLPSSLADIYESKFKFISCTVPSFEQYILAKFISMGYFERHLNRMKKYYKLLREELQEVFESINLNGKCKIVESVAGLHFMLKLESDFSNDVIKQKLALEGIRVGFMSDYYHDNRLCNGEILINYSGLTVDKFTFFLRELKIILEENE